MKFEFGHVDIKYHDVAVRELGAKGAELMTEPREIREGVKVAFIRGPEDDVIEIVERKKGLEGLGHEMSTGI